MHNIGIFTSSRADFGILRNIANKIESGNKIFNLLNSSDIKSAYILAHLSISSLFVQT